MQEITMVRVYLSEGRDHFERLVNWLHDDGRVQGVSVFRASRALVMIEESKHLH